MITFEDVPVYLACGVTDLRKQINGLSVVVSAVFELDPFKPALFVFCNRNKNRIKILTFDGDGFVLTFKRLEKGRFIWPQHSKDEACMKLDRDEFYSLLNTTRLVRKIARDEVSERRVY
jgi:transposase